MILINRKSHKFINFLVGLALFLPLHSVLSQNTTTLQPTNPQNAKSQVKKACEANFSGSGTQIDDCLLCAKKASDINSKKFNICMSSGSDLYLPSIDDPLEELFPKKRK